MNLQSSEEYKNIFVFLCLKKNSLYKFALDNLLTAPTFRDFIIYFLSKCHYLYKT